MMDPHKLQCMTTAMRLIGFAAGLEDTPYNQAVKGMLNQAARLLLVEWNTYAAENGYDMYDYYGTVIKSPTNG